MSKKITPAMLAALDKILANRDDISFRTGEALRKRGLADRLSTYVHRREYVTHDSVTPQFVASLHNPVVWHEWYITQEGKWALRDAGSPHVPA